LRILSPIEILEDLPIEEVGIEEVSIDELLDELLDDELLDDPPNEPPGNDDDEKFVGPSGISVSLISSPSLDILLNKKQNNNNINIRISLMEYVSSLISNAIDNSAHHLQTIIHPEINFRYNSLNLLISRRGAGKTFTVMTELIKLSQIPDIGGYTTFLYVSDKSNDATVHGLINLIKLKVRIVSYAKILIVLKDLTDGKSAYEEVLNKNLQNVINSETRNDLFTTLDLTHWTTETPHTIILLDDAINVLKDRKFKELNDLLFQNRQPRLTIFICA
jgi:hypothetical protein